MTTITTPKTMLRSKVTSIKITITATIMMMMTIITVVVFNI